MMDMMVVNHFNIRLYYANSCFYSRSILKKLSLYSKVIFRQTEKCLKNHIKH